MTLSEAKRLYNQGQQKLAAGDLQGAIAKFNQALEFNPKYYLALLKLGDIIVQLNRNHESLGYYSQALEIQPNCYEALVSYGTALLTLGLYEKALNSYEKALRINTKDIDSWLGKGSALNALGQYEESLENYNQAINEHPDDSRLYVNRSQVLGILERYREAIIDCDRALRISSDWMIWYNRGGAFFCLSLYEEAIKNYREAIRLEPKAHEVWADLGLALHSLKRYDEALDSYDKAIKANRNDGVAWLNRGLTLIEMNRFEDAIKHYDAAVTIFPNDYHLWSNRSQALKELKLYEEALLDLEKAIEINQSSAGVWRNKGSALITLKHYEAALESYSIADSIDGGDFESLHDRAIAFVELERYEEAAVDLIASLQIKADDIPALNILGFALSELNQHQEAQKIYERSLSLDPNQPLILCRKGNSLFYQNLTREAIAIYEQALIFDDQCWLAWLNKGLLISLFQSFDEAIKIWDEALNKLESDSPRYIEGVGSIYKHKGLAYYREGQNQSRSSNKFWQKAADFYNKALKSFEQLTSKKLYLETLQDLIKVLLGLGSFEEVNELLRLGTDYLQTLLDETPCPGKRKLLALKFIGFNQLSVDRYVQSEQVKEALETAERGKNTCLSWLLYALSDEVASPEYDQMQQLLSPGTAIAYWHLSPAALTTFVLKPGEAAPILITTPSTSDRPESLQRLLKLEAWMKEWDDQYRDYRKDKDQRNPSHSWRKDMAQRLIERQEEPGNLKEILNIGAIEQHLSGIDHLILIPHRDLHRFPLHALFSDRFTVSYLPSIQVGLTLQPHRSSTADYLLSIENPTSKDYRSLGFARIEAEGIYQCFDQSLAIREQDANKTQIEAALANGFNVFHFAGHAEHVPHDPKKSRLVLAPDETRDAHSAPDTANLASSHSPHLTLEDLQHHNLSSYDLVNLSACETAITNNQTITTEYVGLVSGFLQNGAAQVVSTLWTVESAASALVMIEFYRRRQLNKSDAVALAQAVTWLKHLTGSELQQWWQEFLAQLPEDLNPQRKAWIKQTLQGEDWDKIGTEQVFSDPYYWAAFTISGRRSQ